MTPTAAPADQPSDSGSIVTERWTWHGVEFAAAISADGATTWWALTPGAGEGAWCIPAHEQTGPLPRAFAVRLALLLPRTRRSNAP